MEKLSPKTTLLTEEQLRRWLSESLRQHARLSTAVLALLENMLKKNGIEYLNVTSRVKTLEGALEKVRRKEYDDPKKQLTDLSGIRVITFLESQVRQISDLIDGIFEVDKANSLDRAKILGHDRIGYRSTHFVCSLGAKRGALPEYESLGSLKFEIQIRTVLQHAWAELAHDRSFKFGATLPTKIQRKLNLYSGMLEVVDESFDVISKEIDAYAAEIAKKSINQISDVEVNSISIAKFIDEIKSLFEIAVSGKIQENVYDEMSRLGVKTIGDIRAMISTDFVKAYKSAFRKKSTATSLIRRAMAYQDMDRYFAAKPEVTGMRPATYKLLAKKYDEKHIKQLLRNNNVTLLAGD